eukprot:5295035-Amphidinium_carterae.1
MLAGFVLSTEICLIPMAVFDVPEEVWSVRDPQIARNALRCLVWRESSMSAVLKHSMGVAELEERR